MSKAFEGELFSELDMTPLLPPDEASYYHIIIGLMRWMVKLGRINIAVKVLQFSAFLAMPYRKHIVSALHIMSYLRIKHNSRLALDPTYAKNN